ncbi:polysaccharide pyruvyl transferase family protein, partial [Solirubrobacter deserti]
APPAAAPPRGRPSPPAPDGLAAPPHAAAVSPPPLRRVLICSATALDEDGAIVSVGDEALVDALADALRHRYPGVDVRRTLKGADVPGRVPVRPVRALAGAIRASDLVIAGGGTMFQEDVDTRGIAGLLRYLIVVATTARGCGVSFAITAVGAENLRHRASRAAARYVLRRARTVSARDAATAALLREVGGRDVALAADTMFLPGVRLPDPPAPDGSVAVSLRADAPDSLIDGLAEWLAADGRPVTLVPMDRRAHSDGAALDALASKLAQPCHVVPRTATWQEVYRAVAAADVCVGMRLHFTVFAALAGRPTVVVGSAPKTRSFAADLDLRLLEPRAEAAWIGAVMDTATPPDPIRLATLRTRAENALAALDEAVGAARPSAAAASSELP